MNLAKTPTLGTLLLQKLDLKKLAGIGTSVDDLRKVATIHNYKAAEDELQDSLRRFIAVQKATAAGLTKLTASDPAFNPPGRLVTAGRFPALPSPAAAGGVRATRIDADGTVRVIVPALAEEDPNGRALSAKRDGREALDETFREALRNPIHFR